MNTMWRRSLVQTGVSRSVGGTYRADIPAVQVRNFDDLDGPAIVGYAAVWNRYSQNLGGFVEQLDPEVFTRQMDADDQVASYDHEYASLLGRRSAGTLHVETDNVGLRYVIPVDMNDPDHQRVVAKINRGDLLGSSFTAIPDPDGCEWDYTEQGMLLCTMRSARLLEVGPVVFPAYKQTEDEGASVALRSLATKTGRDIGELVDAARRGVLTETVAADVAASDDSACTDAGSESGTVDRGHEAIVNANRRRRTLTLAGWGAA